MGDEEMDRVGKGPGSVANDDSLTPTERFARAVQRRDALIRDRQRREDDSVEADSRLRKRDG